MHFSTKPLELLPRFYSGSGPSALSPDGSILYSCSLSTENVPKIHATLIHEGVDSVSSFTIEPNAYADGAESDDVPIAMAAADGLLFISFRISNMLNVYKVSSDQNISVSLHQSMVPHSNNNPVIGMLLVRQDLLLTSSTDKTIRLWHVSSGTLTLVNSIRPDSVSVGMDCLSNGEILATISVEGAIRLWSLSTCKPITAPLVSSEVAGDSIAGSACFAVKFFVVAYRSGILVIWDLMSKSIVRKLGLPSSLVQNEITTVASTSHQSREAWIGTSSLGIFRLTSDLQLVSSQELSIRCNKLLFIKKKMEAEVNCSNVETQNGICSDAQLKRLRAVALGLPTLPLISVFDLEDYEKTPILAMTTIGDPGEVTDLASVGNCFIFASDSGALVGIREGKGWPILSSKIEDSPILSLSQGINGRIVSGSKNGTISLWRVHDKSQQPIGGTLQISLQDSVNVGKNVAISGVALTPNDNIFSIGSDGMIRQWSIESTKITSDSAILGHAGATITSIAACKHMGSNLLITGSQDKEAKVWDASGVCPVLKHTLTGHTRSIWSVAIGANTLRAAVAFTASADMTIRVWNADTGAALSVLGGPSVDGSHTGSILRVAIFPPFGDQDESTHIASCGADGLAKVWNWRSRACESTIETKEFCSQKLWSLLIHPQDGRSILAGPGLIFSEISAEVGAREHTARTIQMEAEQALRNAISLGAIDDAVRLALENSQPLRLLALLRQCPNAIDPLIKTLPLERQKKLLGWTSEWITARPSDAALCQHLLALMLNQFPPALLLEEEKKISSMLPYCKRLWERFDDGLISLGALDALLCSMTAGLQ